MLVRALSIVVSLAVLAYVALCGVMWARQRSFLYFPDKVLAEPEAYGLESFVAGRLVTDDGVGLTVWDRSARDGWPTLVIFHGNGGNLGNNAPMLKALADAGFGIVALSYRGYGDSEGEPSEQGLYRDGAAALDYARKTRGPQARLILFGRSLGSGVAVELARRQPEAGLVLVTPYDSMTEMARVHMPWLPGALLLTDRYESIDKIGAVRMPVLVIHGTRDDTVPIANGRRLFEAAPEPKQALWIEGAGHNDIPPETIATGVVDFCRAKVAGGCP